MHSIMANENEIKHIINFYDSNQDQKLNYLE